MEEKNKEDIRELVIARLQTLPNDKGVSIGSVGNFTKDDLIQHVESGDAIGDKIIEVEMNFLKALKEGVFYGQDFALNHEA
jgi:hypothetical protein